MSAPQPYTPWFGPDGRDQNPYEHYANDAREWWRWYFAGQIAAARAHVTSEPWSISAHVAVTGADALIAALEAKPEPRS
jgi:hypothetical protein